MALHISRRNEWGVYLQRMPKDPVEVFVLFVNTTNRTLDLYWVRDPNMERIQFTLKPNSGVPVNTYNTHIWFFRDYYSGETMHVRSKRLFFPAPLRMPKDPRRPEELTDVRTQILIQFPVRTLKENCLWLIARWLKRTTTTPRSYINNYMIPLTLKQQLHILLNSIEIYRGEAHLHRQHMNSH